MPTFSGRSSRAVIFSAAGILLITMGIRQTTGLLIAPISASTGLGIVALSLAFAIGQFVWGLGQPIFGAIADKHGSFWALVAGAFLLAAGLASAPYLTSRWGMVVSFGVLSACGAAAGSFSVLFGAAAQQLPMEHRAFASGFINAGGSFGQFVFAPLVQYMISARGWVPAVLALAVAALFTIPLAAWVGTRAPAAHPPGAAHTGLWEQIKRASVDRSYLCLHAGFFTCGFHVAFLVTHLPGEVALCNHPATVSAVSLGLIGLFNIAGSLMAGFLGMRYRMKYLLALMYGSRTVMILVFLASPKTALTFYVFAAALGLTWLATVPPTAGLVGKLFGTKYLATLFGLTLLTHQVGAFLGAWLGGLAMAHSGNLAWMWYADALLAALAALVNLPIREDKILVSPVPEGATSPG